MAVREIRTVETYLNPVYPKSFPDPFILKFKGEYFGYSTGSAADGNIFSIIRSNDLVRWTEVGGAMQPLESSPPYYWAPEVTYSNGKFYLYYSVGNEALMEIRVGVSDRPNGGFVDTGHKLTTQDFAIDAHVFVDDDGSKYLFYATDFLDYTQIGTGTVVDRMLDWFTLEGDPQPVTRAKYDWQVYDPARKEKGGVRWHTVEGPAVLKRKGLYYEMFSGGNWQNTSYGVSFAVSHEIGNPEEWSQFSDGAQVLPILRTLDERVVGPGHNCIVRGPNNRELYCVYHRWIDGNRVMAIDRLDFAGERMFVVGASHAPQPAPYEPTVNGFDHGLSGLETIGDWRFEDNSALSATSGRCEIRIAAPSSFLCELTFACSGEPSDDGRIGIELDSGGSSFNLTILPSSNVIRIQVPEESPGLPLISKLSEDFDWSSPHLLRIECDYRRMKIELDGTAMPKIETFLARPVTSLSFHSDDQSVGLASCELTEGFEELFEAANAISDNGWEVIADPGYRIENGELLFASAGAITMCKHRALEECEFAANFRLMDTDVARGTFGLSLRITEGEVLRYAVDVPNSFLTVNGDPTLPLPYQLEPHDYHQLRIVRSNGRSICYFDDMLVGEVATRTGPATCSVFGDSVQLAIEMVRLTAI